MFVPCLRSIDSDKNVSYVCTLNSAQAASLKNRAKLVLNTDNDIAVAYVEHGSNAEWLPITVGEGRYGNPTKAEVENIADALSILKIHAKDVHTVSFPKKWERGQSLIVQFKSVKAMKDNDG